MSAGAVYSWTTRALRLREQNRRALIAIFQIGIFICSGFAAFLLRFDFGIPAAERRHLALAVVIWVVVKAAAFRFSQLGRGWWKYVSLADVRRILNTNLAASVVSTFLIRAVAGPAFPRSIFALDFLLCFMASVGIRVLVRINAEAMNQDRQTVQAQKIFIYGAGTAGATLLREIRSDPKLPYAVAGFIDDDPSKHGLRISDTPVLGSGQQLPELARRHHIAEVLIAIPSGDGPRMSVIIDLCLKAHLPCKTIPGLAEIIQGNGLAPQIRKIQVEDLLGRSPVHLKEFHHNEKLQGRVVMVTGAGGSIGSELCRQIARSDARALIAFEISESALFELERELRTRFPGFLVHAAIGSTQNARRLSEVLSTYKPSVLFHAAAYKHVPIMESHPFESVENNVFGSVTAALCAVEHQLTDFVMISTDKAVRPTSVMGVTKRIAELAIDSFQTGQTKCVSVRFGNVLESNGSVVPLFKEQIAQGGPVTVTHPDMERYFMTIPEAVQLVLQASTMGKGGEIFVLDMGKPVKIVDLATKLILLSGLRPGEDIKIKFTGIREGEKLREEVKQLQESVVPTHHEKIKILRGLRIPSLQMKEHLLALCRICETRDVSALLQRFQEIVPEFTPGAHLLERALETIDPVTLLSMVSQGKSLEEKLEAITLEPDFHAMKAGGAR